MTMMTHHDSNVNVANDKDGLIRDGTGQCNSREIGKQLIITTPRQY